MTVILHTITILLIAVLVIIHDRRMSDIEERQEELMRRVEQLARRHGRPYV